VISHYTQSFMGMMPWGALLLGWAAMHFGVTDAVSFGALVVIASATITWLSGHGRSLTESWRRGESMD
jgi:hypothetical protein